MFFITNIFPKRSLLQTFIETDGEHKKVYSIQSFLSLHQIFSNIFLHHGFFPQLFQASGFLSDEECKTKQCYFGNFFAGSGLENKRHSLLSEKSSRSFKHIHTVCFNQLRIKFKVLFITIYSGLKESCQAIVEKFVRLGIPLNSSALCTFAVCLAPRKSPACASKPAPPLKSFSWCCTGCEETGWSGSECGFGGMPRWPHHHSIQYRTVCKLRYSFWSYAGR